MHLKILILTNLDLGLYKFRKELLESLSKDHIIYAALPKGEYLESLQQLGCTVIPFDFDRRGMNPFADFGQLQRYKRLLREIKPDLVLTYTIKPNVYGGIACQRMGIPYIANITGLGTSMENGGLLSFLTTALYRFGLRKAACVFFQNKSNEQLFYRKRITTGRTRTIPGSGVNLETHCYEPYPPDAEGVRFLFVGRIMKDKGVDELLEAMKIIHSERPDTVLDIVGWNDENYTDALRRAEAEGLIRFHGLQKNVHPFYSACHCAVLPSYHEGTANVMLEASSTGRPVITTTVSGCKETFDEGITGFGCEARNTESLIIAIRNFLLLSQKQRERMGIAARKKMEREYDRNFVLAAYTEEINRAGIRSG